MAETRIRERTLSGRFHPQKSRGAGVQNYEPSYAKKQGRQAPVTLTQSRGSTGMLEGMTGRGSFTKTELNIGMAFATSRHRRIAEYHNDQGIRTKRGTKIRHFLYLSRADIRAIARAVGESLGFTIVTG